ncbi:MAG: ATP-binding protein, partial [Spirochaetia bacterium]|nr:ATP-binding protein [Spirochaetia bacterium]
MRASNISRIKPLPAVLIDRIAAGEVIEGPHSVIKECVENALDAHAQAISVHTKKAGLEQILIQDDGDGILYEDLGRAIERHATSKISDLDDLETVLSY